jgi:hypothetical protein
LFSNAAPFGLTAILYVAGAGPRLAAVIVDITVSVAEGTVYAVVAVVAAGFT